ncbi:MAG: hypothetical protein M1814_006116 [Vezdaea aestivalis]|nr:MAG: hypothetical protein M1814_006116 [Vezdaea aestivalis]
MYTLGTLTNRWIKILICLSFSVRNARAPDPPAIPVTPPLFQPPSEYNPYHAVTCIDGSVPHNHGSPGMTRESHPSYLSMCAKSAYGGNTYINAGGYCPYHPLELDSLIDINLPMPFLNIVFDPETAHSTLKRQNVRVICQARCWCTHFPNANAAYVNRPHMETVLRLYLPARPSDLEVLALDLPTYTLHSLSGIWARSQRRRALVQPIVIHALSESHSPNSRRWQAVSQEEGEFVLITPFAGYAPTCVGDGSTRPVAPERRTMLAAESRLSEQEICAAEQHGGYNRGNVGAYCHNGDLIMAEELAHPRLTRRTSVGTFWIRRCHLNCVCGKRGVSYNGRPTAIPTIDMTPTTESCGEPCQSSVDCDGGLTKYDSGYLGDTSSSGTVGSNLAVGSCFCVAHELQSSLPELGGVSAPFFSAASCVSWPYLVRSKSSFLGHGGRRSNVGRNKRSLSKGETNRVETWRRFVRTRQSQR